MTVHDGGRRVRQATCGRVQKRPQVVHHHLEAASSQPPLGLLVGGLPGWEALANMTKALRLEDFSGIVNRLKRLARDGFTNAWREPTQRGVGYLYSCASGNTVRPSVFLSKASAAG